MNLEGKVLWINRANILLWLLPTVTWFIIFLRFVFVYERNKCMRETEEGQSDTTVMSDWSVAWHLSLVHVRSPQDPLLSASVSATHEWFININTKHKPQCASHISFPLLRQLQRSQDKCWLEERAKDMRMKWGQERINELVHVVQ